MGRERGRREATGERAGARGRERARSARSDGRGRERGAKYPSDDRATRSGASKGACATAVRIRDGRSIHTRKAKLRW